MLLQWLRQQQKPSQIHVSPLKWKMFMCVERWDEVWCWCSMQRNRNWTQRKKTHSTSPSLCIAHGAFGRFILRAAFELPLSASQFIESIFFLYFFCSKHTNTHQTSYAFQTIFLSICKMIYELFHGIRCYNCCEWSTVSNSFASMEFSLPLSFCLCVFMSHVICVVCVALVFQINFPSFTVSRWKIRFV